MSKLSLRDHDDRNNCRMTARLVVQTKAGKEYTCSGQAPREVSMLTVSVPQRTRSDAGPRPPEQPQPSGDKPVVTHTLERRHNQGVAVSKLTGKWSVHLFKKCWDSYKKINPEKETWERSGRGVLTLMNLEKEMKEDEGGRSRGREREGRRGGPASGDAVLVELGEGGWTGNAQRKNVGMWDPSSHEAFSESLNQSLNKLTEPQVLEIVGNIVTNLTSGLDACTPEDREEKLTARRNTLVKVVVNKAASERVFAVLYASFTKGLANRTEKCVAGVCDAITEEEEGKFDDWVRNPGESEADENMCTGHAAFYGALCACGLVPMEKAVDAFKAIVSRLEEESVNPHHIMMLSTFVERCGPQCVRNFPAALWQSVEGILTRESIPRRLHFIIQDVIEMKNCWIAGRQMERKQDQASESDIDKLLREVRSAYTDYYDDDSTFPSVNLTAPEFARGAMEFLPTVKEDDCGFFAMFVSGVLLNITKGKKDRELKDSIAKAVGTAVARLAQGKIESDVPHVWKMVSVVLCELMLKSIIEVRAAEGIHYTFDPDPWDILDDLKWYIFDFYDFSEAVDLGKFPFPEIAEAMMMPDRITKRILEIRMSRLTATALVRSVFVKLPQERCGLDSVKVYRDFLRRAFERQRRAFDEAVAEEFRSADRFAFSREEFYALLK